MKKRGLETVTVTVNESASGKRTAIEIGIGIGIIETRRKAQKPCRNWPLPKQRILTQLPTRCLASDPRVGAHGLVPVHMVKMMRQSLRGHTDTHHRLLHQRARWNSCKRRNVLPLDCFGGSALESAENLSG
jgi:hypothetical protein